MKTCGSCQFGTPRYIRGIFPDGEIDPNYVTCAWLALNLRNMPDSLYWAANHLNEIQNPHTERACPCWTVRHD